MPTYPLIFKFAQLVRGRGGFVARVHGGGRLLVYLEDREWCASGVEPGALHGMGVTPIAAYADFRDTLRVGLEAIAEEADTFEAFRREAKAFLCHADATESARWTETIQQIRSGELKPGDGLEDLGRLPAESNVTITIDLVGTYATSEDSLAFAEPDRLAA